MVEINNGVNTEKIKSKENYDSKDGVFRMVTVGTLFPYHGYDRVLAGLKDCKEEVDGHPVEFHIVGASQTIDELKAQAQKLGLKRVIFHGMKKTDELNEMYEEFDVGLGCLALHRRNADIDTTLKIIEYYCRGVPVVTSGKSPYKDPAVTICVPDGEDPVDINRLYCKWKNIDEKKLRKLSEQAKKEFSWNFIMKQLLMACGIV
nr:MULTISPECIES: glycosyltransferase [Clostridia]